MPELASLWFLNTNTEDKKTTNSTSNGGELNQGEELKVK